jgi:hypothetical protein
MSIPELLEKLSPSLHEDAMIAWGKAKSWLSLANAMLPDDAAKLKEDLANLFLHTVVAIAKRADLDGRDARTTLLHFTQQAFALGTWEPVWWEASYNALKS